MKDLLDQYESSYRDAFRDRSALRAKAMEFEDRAAFCKKEVDRLNKEADAIPTPNWIDNVIYPLAKRLSVLSGKASRVCGPFGIGARVMLTLHNENDPDDYCEWTDREDLTVEPRFNDGALELWYVTGETRDLYPKGSIGEINGFNSVLRKLPDDESEILKLFHHYETGPMKYCVIIENTLRTEIWFEAENDQDAKARGTFLYAGLEPDQFSEDNWDFAIHSDDGRVIEDWG